MTPEELFKRTETKLRETRDMVVRAVPEDWCNERVDDLLKETGLKRTPRAGYEIRIRSVEDGPDCWFVTRSTWEKAVEFSRDDSDQNRALERLEQFILENLPVRGACEDIGILDRLGCYKPEGAVIGASIELYWARIAAYCLKESAWRPDAPPPDAGALARVVMTHELAHYVTHQGYTHSNEGCYWTSFEKAESFIQEVVAQAATSFVARLDGVDLGTVFDRLLENQPTKYTAHREISKIVQKLGETPGFFWGLFRDRRNHDCFASTSSREELTTEIEVWDVLKKGSEKSGLDLTY